MINLSITSRLLKRSAFIVLVQVLGLSSIVYSQEMNDTIPELEIWGFPEEKFAVGSNTSKVDSGVLQLFQSSRLADILQYATPVYIKAYGPGNLATISFRGTGANHTAVLWNGININSPTLGQTDFYNVPNLAFDELSIHHGNGSALFGTGAIGGTVQLGNHASWKEGFHVTLQQGVGSFGKLQSAVKAVYGKGNLELSTKLFRTKATNDFEFVNTQRIGNPKQRQDNAAYQQWGIVQDVFWDITPENRLSGHIWYNNSDRQVQPPMTRITDDDHQWDESFRSLIQFQHLSNWGTTTTKASWIRDFMRFDNGTTVINSRILTDRFTGVVSQEKRFGKLIETKIGAQLTHFKTNVEAYADGTSESRWDFFWLTNFQLSEKLKASVQMRQTLLENFDPPFSPSIGLDWEFLTLKQHHLSLKGNTSRAYRVPTLNERYWQPGGNPDILPEDSRSIEGGLHYQYKKKMISAHLSATCFYTTINNWVYWRPTPPSGFFSPQNVQKVRTQGLELSGSFSGKLGATQHTFGGNYAYTNASILESDEPNTVGDALFYVPEHKGNTYYRVGFSNFSAIANWSFTGTRLAIARNELAAFNVLDIGLSKKMNFGNFEFLIQTKINNTFNTSYQNYELYAMPGRNYEFVVQLKI